MDKKRSLFTRGLSVLYRGINFLTFNIFEKNHEKEIHDMNVRLNNGIPDKSILFAEEILDEFRKDVGRYKPETGGMIASSKSETVIDKCYFDMFSKNTSGSFYYDVETMSEVFRDWNEKGYITNGIYHSHPRGMTHPSYHDISSALLHIDFFNLDYFYLPIFQPEKRGFYTMYFYVVRKNGEDLLVDLNYVLQATQDGYEYVPFRAWARKYPIDQLNSYRDSIDRVSEDKVSDKKAHAVKDDAVTACEINEARRKVDFFDFDLENDDNNQSKEEQNMKNNEVKTSMTGISSTHGDEYFEKVASLYPDKVLDKVIVCVGTGGARSFLENCARSGFRNYILIDADVVSPSNVATQGVFISEMGKKKVDAIRDRIIDINPSAKVVCVDRFLDNSMSDEEFKTIMDLFPNKKPNDYLILGCTDNFEAQKRSSLLALKYGTPYLAAMMYEGGAAAEIIFVYPGVTESCPRCLLRDRFEKYENGFVNDVTSSSCPIFATERMNSLKGYIALMLLMYREDENSPFSRMLDDVKDRNFVEIRLTPYLKDSKLGIGLFDRVFEGASRYVYFDETLWIPQHPDRIENGEENCRLCGGTGDLRHLAIKWANVDTRYIRFDAPVDEQCVSAVSLASLESSADTNVAHG